MGWWWRAKKKNSDDDDDKNNSRSALSSYISINTTTDDLKERLMQETQQWTTTQSVAVGVAGLTGLAIGFRFGRVRYAWWRPLRSLQDLSSADIGPMAPWMRGKVVKVSDGDTIRWVHQPTWFHTAGGVGNNKDHRLALRLCSIDTPETAKFGKPGMAYGDEAKQYLKSLCLNQTVKVKVLQIDQYGRGVASAKKRRFWFLPWLPLYLDEAMLKAGLAEVYTGSGAVYGRLGNKDKYLKLMEKAKDARKGMWSDPNRETAAEYKRRTK